MLKISNCGQIIRLLLIEHRRLIPCWVGLLLSMNLFDIWIYAIKYVTFSVTSNTAPLDVTLKWSRLRVKKSSVWSKWFQALSGLKFSKKSIDRYRIKFDNSTIKYLYGFRKIKIIRELRTALVRVRPSPHLDRCYMPENRDFSLGANLFGYGQSGGGIFKKVQRRFQVQKSIKWARFLRMFTGVEFLKVC